jgi:hypothetical protein
MDLWLGREGKKQNINGRKKERNGRKDGGSGGADLNFRP